MATKLGLFNGALRVLGVARLSTVTDNVKARYLLDDVYDEVLLRCLRNGDWNFAMRTTQESSDGTPSVHSFTHYYDKPTDWVRTVMMSSSETFRPALRDYEDEANVWYVNVSPLYVKYVSSDASFGGDLTLFPPDYTAYVHHELAYDICEDLTGKDPEDAVRKKLDQARSKALSNDARDGPPREMPAGSWVTSRGWSPGDTRWNRETPS